MKLTFFPDRYYEVSPEDLHFAGGSQPNVKWDEDTCTFIMPEGGNITVYEEFKLMPVHDVYVRSNGLPLIYELKVNGETTDKARRGDDVSLILNMEEGHYIDTVEALDRLTGEVKFHFENRELKQTYQYDFIMPDCDLSIVPAAIREFAIYADENGDVYKAYDIKRINSSRNLTLTSGWYVVNENATIDKRVEINGDVYLILSDNTTLTCKQGIHNSKGNTLTIWGQEEGNGNLDAKQAIWDYAGIGGDKDENGGAFILHSGRVSSEGGKDAAGIGGGYSGEGGCIRIYGGEVFGEGDYLDTWDWYTAGGAGIGGGDDGTGGTIVINGGDITAIFEHEGAGIGGGKGNSGGTITINGGQITAKSYQGAGIGGGLHGNCGSIVINGGTINTESEALSSAIGTSDASSIGGGSIRITGGTIDANAHDRGNHCARAIRARLDNTGISLGDSVCVEDADYADRIPALYSRRRVWVYEAN